MNSICLCLCLSLSLSLYIYIYIYTYISLSEHADDTDSLDFLSLSLSLYIYIYIYIHHQSMLTTRIPLILCLCLCLCLSLSLSLSLSFSFCWQYVKVRNVLDRSEWPRLFLPCLYKTYLFPFIKPKAQSVGLRICWLFPVQREKTHPKKVILSDARLYFQDEAPVREIRGMWCAFSLPLFPGLYSIGPSAKKIS